MPDAINTADQPIEDEEDIEPEDDTLDCDRCDESLPEDEAREVEGDTWCPGCADRHSTTCDDCGNAVRCRNTHHVNGNSVCESCYEGYYYCSSRSEYVTEDDYAGDDMCQSCYESAHAEDSDVILDYSDKRTLESKGKFGTPKDRTWFGVELETEILENTDRESAAECVLDAIGNDFCVLKDDGSLTGGNGLKEGFEIVTAPATPEIQIERFTRLFDAIDRSPRGSDLKALRSWQSGHCGIHVHVSRSGLSALQLGRLLVFVNSRENRAFIETVAGRGSNRYAEVIEKKLTSGHARNQSRNRYEAINTTNYNTVEFRLFRGTLKRESFFKALEFVFSIVRFVRATSNRKLSHTDYLAWLQEPANLKDYPNLAAFLRRGVGYLPPAKVNPNIPAKPQTTEI